MNQLTSPVIAPMESQVSAASVTPQPRLVRAAHEFEAQMMNELLKPMTHGDSLTGDDEDAGLDSGSGSGSALGDFATEALGQALSRQGGFGIANRIVKDLSHSKGKNGNQSTTGKVTGR